MTKFVAGLDLNPSLSREMTVALYQSTINLEAQLSNPEVSMGTGILRRTGKLVKKSLT